MPALCPCGTFKTYSNCCQPFHLATKVASSPEQLMRSRYSAFALAKCQYLVDSLVAKRRKPDLAKELADYLKTVNFVKLEVIDASAPDQANARQSGTVEFKAYFQEVDGEGNTDKRFYCLHEISSFERVDSRWYYDQGQFPHQVSQVKLDRNQTCLCGSGKKYKKCCGR